MDIRLEDINQGTVDMAYDIVEKEKDIDKAIDLVRELYDNIRNDNFLLSKRRLEMILFRLFVLKYYSVDDRIGIVERGLYCRQTEESAAYRADVIRAFSQTFDIQKAVQQYLKRAIDYMNEGSKELAFQYFMKAALEGSTIAAYQCGKMMMQGEGCEKDTFLAAFWHWQAVMMDNKNAIASLAYDYYDGRGVWPGKVRAMYWFATGTHLLEPTCIRELSDMLQNGEIIPGEEETGKALAVSLEHLDEPETAAYVKQVGAAINVITAEWLQENEGGI